MSSVRLAAASALGYTGRISGSDTSAAASAGASGGAAGAGTTGGADGGAAGTTAMTLAAPPTALAAAQPCTSQSPGQRLLRRLTAPQFQSTLRDLFYVDTTPT